jgi:hypothetical protein
MNYTIGFTHGVVYRKQMLYVAAVNMDLEDRDFYHGYILRWDGVAWAHWPVENRIYALDAFDTRGGRTVLAMGPDGRVHVAEHRGFHWEMMDTADDGPSDHRCLTCLRRVGGHVYSAGMSRMVYRRPLDGGRWERADTGARVPRTSIDIAGFLSLDGFDERDLYAVGFHGDIWHSDGAYWQPLDSPTNLKLECVRCVEDGRVYIAGAKGLILRGRGASWDVVEQDLTEETFWGMEFAFGSLYLSTDVGLIYRLAGDVFSPVETGLGKRITTRGLHCNDGVLLSTGAHDLCLFDGQRWTEVSHQLY